MSFLLLCLIEHMLKTLFLTKPLVSLYKNASRQVSWGFFFFFFFFLSCQIESLKISHGLSPARIKAWTAWLWEKNQKQTTYSKSFRMLERIQSKTSQCQKLLKVSVCCDRSPVHSQKAWLPAGITVDWNVKHGVKSMGAPLPAMYRKDLSHKRIYFIVFNGGCLALSNQYCLLAFEFCFVLCS